MKKLLVLFLVCISITDLQAATSDSVCAVFVVDGRYYQKFRRTLRELRVVGKYKGAVCLIACGGLSKGFLDKDLQNEEVKVVSFPPIVVTKRHSELGQAPEKINAQMQKFHVFQEYFKQWDYVFYLDAGMHIHDKIDRLINCRQKNKIVAHSDCYPDYLWDHTFEFTNDGSEAHKELMRTYDMHCDYFQSGMMLIDTNLIQNDTVKQLIALKDKYPFGRGDQSYISLYFCHIQPAWVKAPLRDSSGFLYDICPRGPFKYVMHKYTRSIQPCILCQ